MKYLVLRRVADDTWERVGAVEVPLDTIEVMGEQRAVEHLAHEGGTYAVIPFDNWVILEAEARIEVRPVPVLAPDEPTPEEQERDAERFAPEGADEVEYEGGRELMDGLERPRA